MTDPIVEMSDDNSEFTKTDTYGLFKIKPGAMVRSWGHFANVNLDMIDAVLAADATRIQTLENRLAKALADLSERLSRLEPEPLDC